ncbi:peptide chain release factor-like protein [Nonlabens xiamenensis]|uniref:peptide chain release factor-like protein n=1 Tax=Nonlabens xiamenensis TaxID=2341043 RepID=UPI000F60EB69|nr:peptide chain release factor-like protein [Nonlabens xiamenensis]
MNVEQLEREVTYTATTSSGPGGQHVNKVATRVVLDFDLISSQAFSSEAPNGQTISERERIIQALKHKLTKDGFLQLSSQQTRSQAKNKELVFKKLLEVLSDAAKIKKKRKKRHTPAWVKRKRLNDKKKHSQKKQDRNYRY